MDRHLDRCAVTPYGRGAGSSRVRVFEWLDRVGTDFTVSSYLSLPDAAASRLAHHPVSLARAELRLGAIASARPRRLLLHREASPLSRGWWERRLLRSAELAVYDFDDALQWDRGEGGLVRRLAPKADKVRVAVRHADRVIAGNAVLADWASQHHRDVLVIPSCVALEDYMRKTSYVLNDPPRLGWIGSPHNEAFLRLIAGALTEVHRRTGARLTLVGTTTPSLGGLESFIDRVAWSPDSQRTELAAMDIGLMPLPTNSYSLGKCGYKLLQYAAAGLPAVASPLGVNADLLTEFGLPAPQTQDEWTTAILGLISSPAATRERLGRTAREITGQRYSYDAWLPRWAAALELGPVTL
ncbi:glycosyltransferase family 4 protein [Streptomyces neyagawaensis]|uniref:glycosyltransferase family 4 protein n=1 Tax=Streptomyces neyagawaensis TaxID=42238 RepID=UPI0006E2009B|nr:glycosyltransferase family 4 protein [Streptomyces neyagawaensis]MCL6738328.1 glycosyltransferase family 4 protein [Streptomyces neyagawaensis]MDE1688163.1 glycosyltransferase family 4 protein [Streptomyces neyagawaensis]